MELPISRSDVQKADPDVPELMRRIASGRAVLFVGAGFSAGAINLQGEPMLRAKELAHRISALIDLDKDDDLRYVADRAIEKRKASELVEF